MEAKDRTKSEEYMAFKKKMYDTYLSDYLCWLIVNKDKLTGRRNGELQKKGYHKRFKRRFRSLILDWETFTFNMFGRKFNIDGLKKYACLNAHRLFRNAKESKQMLFDMNKLYEEHQAILEQYKPKKKRERIKYVKISHR